MLWNLYYREPNTFWMVLVVGAAVVGVELLYFERDELEERVSEGVEDIAERVGDDLREVTDDVEDTVKGLGGSESGPASKSEP